jgi:hypothetical protein
MKKISNKKVKKKKKAPWRNIKKEIIFTKKEVK